MTVTDLYGTVFNIQKFSVHDGPGIRTTVFMKGCPLRCMWCSNAESMDPQPEPGIIIERCNGCGNCVEVCPESALEIIDEKAVLDRQRCSACGGCVAVCSPEALAIYGKRMTVEEAFTQVLKDKAFYSGSGGGVTVSGGEPMRQPGFVGELFRRCKEEGIGTCLDTCGYAPAETLKDLLPVTDNILFDLKIMDREKHLEFTGVDNDLIKENARTAAESDAEVLFRIPLIRGVNCTDDNIRETAEFISSLGEGNAVELLPYHRLGIGKYRILGKEYPGVNLETPDREEIDRTIRIFESFDIKCTAGG